MVGDIFKFKVGIEMPVDAIIISGLGVRMDESLLRKLPELQKKDSHDNC